MLRSFLSGAHAFFQTRRVRKLPGPIKKERSRILRERDRLTSLEVLEARKAELQERLADKSATATADEEAPNVDGCADSSTAASAVATRTDGTIIEDTDGTLAEWVKYSERKVRERIKMVVLPATEQQLGTAIAGWHAGTGTYKTCYESTLIVYDVNSSGEAAIHPHVRGSPLRQEHARMCVKGALIGGGKGT